MRQLPSLRVRSHPRPTPTRTKIIGHINPPKGGKVKVKDHRQATQLPPILVSKTQRTTKKRPCPSTSFPQWQNHHIYVLLLDRSCTQESLVLSFPLRKDKTRKKALLVDQSAESSQSQASARPISKNNNKALPIVIERFDRSDSLLSKRRGEEKASEMAKELQQKSDCDSYARRTAKWKILVSPGLEGIEHAGTPTTFGSPRTVKSGDWTAPKVITPTRRG